MRCKVSILAVSAICFLCLNSGAHALYYYGGAGDGMSFLKGANTYVMTIASTADQSFVMGDAATPMYSLTVSLEAGPVESGSNVQVRIPAGLDMIFDTSDTTAAIGGYSASKVSSTVSFESGGKTLNINVTTALANDDYFTVSGLSFKDFNSRTKDFLTLGLGGVDTDLSTDTKSKAIYIQDSSATFTGGGGDASTSLTGANTYVLTLASSAEQSFTIGDPATPMYLLNITVEAGQIETGTDLKVRIPDALAMDFDTSVATATIAGPSSGKVSTTVSYPDANTVQIDVTSRLVNEDSIAITGLYFKDFTSRGLDYLALRLTGVDGDFDADTYGKKIWLPASTSLFTGGQADGFATSLDYADSGLRYFDGSNIFVIASEEATASSAPLRIRSSSGTRGLMLVDPSDPMASPMRIQTGSGIKALRKL